MNTINTARANEKESLDIFNDIQKYMGEFIGTFTFLFLGIGSIVVSKITGVIGNAHIALVFGASIAILIYCIGGISGADFNPAVSIAKFIVGKLQLKDMIMYIIFQIIASVTACLSLGYIFGTEYIKYSKNSLKQSVLLEFILTVFLVSIILWSGKLDKKYSNLIGILIGATICLEALIFGPITGASMNPVRTLAPAVVSMDFTYTLAYIVVIIFGAIMSAIVYKFLNSGGYHD
jgi:aquaporin Z